jgi:hypothetical protein
MSTNITIKTTIRINGKEYGSFDELPPDLRRTYEQALAQAGSAQHGLVHAGGATTLSRIVFNGQVYAGVNEMPGEIRKLYEDAIATFDKETIGWAGTAVPLAEGTAIPPPALALSPARTESTSSRLIIIGLVITVFILVSFAWGR